MMKWKIPLFKIHWDENDIEAVTKIIRRGTYWADGPEIKEFEKKLTEYFKKKHAVTFNSGTSALHSMLLAYNIKGKEVIVPSFTFISTVNTIILAGGKPVFAEIEQDTMALDYEDVKKRINKKTAAVLFVDYGGCPARDTKELRYLCDEKNILLLEDAAESMGAEIYGEKVGKFSDAAMFSFCQNKIITTGEGAVVVTDSDDIAQKLKLIRSHGRVESDKSYFENPLDNDYIDLGYNFRMPTMNAALGISQLNKIDKIIEKRIENAKKIKNRLQKIKDIKFIEPPEGIINVYQLFSILLKTPDQRDRLQKYLEQNGIMNKVYFNPAHLKTYYRTKFECKDGDLPNTEMTSKKILSLPFYVDMTNNEIDLLISSIEEFF